MYVSYFSLKLEKTKTNQKNQVKSYKIKLKNVRIQINKTTQEARKGKV